MTNLNPFSPSAPGFRFRAGWALTLAGGLWLAAAPQLRAQEEGQPAWERIADKLTPSSLDESSPEELPSVILPEDEQDDAEAAEEAEPSLEESIDGTIDSGLEEDEAAGDEARPAVDEPQPDEDAMALEAAPQEGEAAPAGEYVLEEEGVMVDAIVEESPGASRMDTAAPGTVGLPQAAGGRGARGEARINLGKESQDTGEVANLFDDPEVRRMLGDNPRFIYGALKSPDPMIFPPVRNAAIYAELTAEADRLIKQGKLEEAQQCYKRILDLGDTRYALEMRNKIAQLNNRMGAARMILADEQFIDVKLPPWVRSNSRGILYDEADPMVLVGDYTLRIGDPVPSHPEVRVEAITKHSVTYRVAGRESFTVAVKGFRE